MKKLFCFLFYILILQNVAVAQELAVKSFVLAPTDITAQTEGRKDLNGDACALVKINFVGNVLDVEGNVIKPLVRRNNEVWAYMTQGSREMKVISKGYLPMMVSFRDYGIDKLMSNRTYVLTLVAQGAAKITQNQVLTIKYSPISAMVLVDNKLVKGSNGIAKTSLPIGQHSYVVVCDGYESEEGMVKLKSSAPSNLQITLSKDMSSTLESPEILAIPVRDGVNIEMVKVVAGSFDMGATPEMENFEEDEKPVHRVTLTNDYYIGKNEVTQALWQAVMGSNPSNYKGENLPVEMVSWNDCQEFISKLNLLTGRHFRLPTEAEWEYAARGGNKSRGYQYSGSNILDDAAWYKGTSSSHIHRVATKQPNELGIYDMSGNVWEWCQDLYGEYESYSQTNPIGAVSGTNRVSRGSGWINGAKFCRSSCRFSYTPDSRYIDLGFRLALSL